MPCQASRRPHGCERRRAAGRTVAACRCGWKVASTPSGPSSGRAALGPVRRQGAVEDLAHHRVGAGREHGPATRRRPLDDAERLGGDVAAPLGAGEADQEMPSYALARASATSVPVARDREHPSAGGDQPGVGPRGAGVDHVHVGLDGERLGADDDVARARALGVAGAGHHDGHCGSVDEGGLGDVGQVADGGRREQGAEGRVEQGEQRVGCRGRRSAR